MNKKMSTYIFGVFLILFGVLFMISSEAVFATIVLIAGLALILLSVVKIIAALKSDNPYASYSVTSSVIGIIFGIILIGNRTAAIKVIPILLGIWLLITGITSLLFLVKAKADTKLLARPILKIIIGVIAFALPIIPVIATGIVIGIVLILAGISTIVNVKDEEVIYKVKVKK